jgi:hypothetical protein
VLCSSGFDCTLGAMDRVSGLLIAASISVGAIALVTANADARPCYDIWAEADGSESHFRHFVYVENDCDYWLQCSVWTDVNPQPPKMMSVAPGATEQAETNGRSQVGDPRAFGMCHQK